MVSVVKNKFIKRNKGICSFKIKVSKCLFKVIQTEYIASTRITNTFCIEFEVGKGIWSCFQSRDLFFRVKRENYAKVEN